MADAFSGFLQGLQGAHVINDMRARNALGQAVQQYGATSPQAMSALGAVDPMQAMSFGVKREGMAAEARSERQRRYGAALLTIDRLPEEQQGQAYATIYQRAQAEGADLSNVPSPDEYQPGMAGMLGAYLSGQQPAAMDREPRRYRVGDQLVDADGNVIYSATAPENGFRVASPEEAAQYGAQAGQFGPDGRFYPINPPSGMSVDVGPDGQIRFTQGPGVQQKPFTEGQSKDNVYAVRARGALQALEPIADRLASVTDRALNADPTGLIRGEFQSPEFQVAQQAGDEFLQAILRKDTGAAITEGEQRLYGKTYLPQPGDGPEVLAQKAEARRRAIAALEAGMSPAQMLAVERGLADSPREQQGAGAPPEGVDPADWEYMSPEERALFVK